MVSSQLLLRVSYFTSLKSDSLPVKHACHLSKPSSHQLLPCAAMLLSVNTAHPLSHCLSLHAVIGWTVCSSMGGRYATNAGKTACVCAPGYGGTSCEICPGGTYASGGSMAECTDCGIEFSTPSIGSTSAAACYGELQPPLCEDAIMTASRGRSIQL